MTVSAGDLKGATLTVPESPLLRPTLARVREAVYDIWQFQLDGSTFIDGFAGSGIMGLEALSRGAARVIAIEKQARNTRRIAEQVGAIAERWKLKEDFALRWELRTATLEQAVLDLVAEGVVADLIYLDPPYSYPTLKPLIKLILDIGILAPAGELMVECAVRDLQGMPLPHELTPDAVIREHRFGSTVLVRYRGNARPVPASRLP